jgi:hypothetical protein
LCLRRRGSLRRCLLSGDCLLWDVLAPLSESGLMIDNTWNAYGCSINETVVLENAKFMNESGLLQAGYDYFVIDGMASCVPSYSN